PMLSSQPLRPLPARALLPYTPLFRSRTPSGGPPPAPPKAPGCLPAPGAHGPARVRDRRSRSGAGFPPLHKPADPLESARGKGPFVPFSPAWTPSPFQKVPLILPHSAQQIQMGKNFLCIFRKGLTFFSPGSNVIITLPGEFLSQGGLFPWVLWSVVTRAVIL